MKEAPMWCVVPLSVTAAVSLLLFFYPGVFLRLAELVGGT
jgi:multicomponent Na+:H+ antiporter subunit D